MATTPVAPTGTPQMPNQGAREIKSESLNSIAWKQFRKHPMARFSLSILAVLYLLAAFADFLAPYPERTINTAATFQPPNRIRVWDEGRFVRPYFYPMTQTLDFETLRNVWEEDLSRPTAVAFFTRREGIRDRYVPFPVNLIPLQLRRELNIRPWATLRLFGSADPTAPLFVWGSDDLGSDVYSKILFGGRVSLNIGILAAVVATTVGLVMGGIAGFFGGWIDEVIMRLVEALSAIPGLFLLITLSAVFYPLNLPSATVFALVVTVLALIGWGGVARTVRGQVLSLRERDFAYAAQSLGASNGRIIRRHLLPHTFTYIIISMSLAIPSFIITESALSFFGLGIQPPATSWGLMLNTAQRFVGVTGLADRWWIFLPGVFIFIAVITWNLLGDGLRDAFDPRSRK